jgi:predicted nucleic acid-binding protein
MFILDTNTISHLRNPKRWNVEFAAWESGTDVRECHISAISEFEIQHGIHRVLAGDPVFAKALQDWLDFSVRIHFAQRIIPIDSEICRVAARLAMLPSRDIPDLLIAATALVHDLTVVTRNARHFADTGVRIMNPWQAPGAGSPSPRGKGDT